jgi:hypothetical protein
MAIYLQFKLFSSFASGIKLAKYNDGDVPLNYSALSFNTVVSIVFPALFSFMSVFQQSTVPLLEVPNSDVDSSRLKKFLLMRNPVLVTFMQCYLDIDIRYPISYPRRTICNIWCSEIFQRSESSFLCVFSWFGTSDCYFSSSCNCLDGSNYFRSFVYCSASLFNISFPSLHLFTS